MGNLYIMIGLPGSGKDTAIKTILNDITPEKQLETIVLSSDDVRKELFGWEDQTKNGLVFQEMNKRCKEALINNKNVIYNATNLNKKRRISLIREMKKYINNVYAVLCLCPVGTIYDRNFTRYERHVPEDKLLQMFRMMDVPLMYEGYEKIFFINTDSRYNYEEMISWYLDIGNGYDQQNEHHNATVQEHLLLTAQMAFKYSQDENLYEAGRFHDIAKPYSREWNEEKQKYTYYEHHRMSAYLYLLYYIYDNKIYGLQEIPEDALEISTLIYHHMDKFVGNLEKTKELLGDDLYKKLEILMKADAYREEQKK